MIIKNAGANISSNEVVLFPFDDYSIPFQHGVRLQLVRHKSDIDTRRIVLRPGSPGSPDSASVAYYGTVQRVGDELWMWYLGQGDQDKEYHHRVCLAKSKDGYHWEKPNLNLVEYAGSTKNNLVDLMGGKHHVQACVVFYDPDDPEPKRRFKMAFESNDDRLAVAYSEDGLKWEESPNNPVGPFFEMAGGTKFNGCYYLTGQGVRSHFGQSRELETRISYDFEHWTQCSCLGLRRNNIPPRPMEYYFHAGEQVHLGAALWNRGNVIIGFYGQWHGHPSNDRRLLTMDLGLVVSNDALHYREPIPDFRIVPAAEDSCRPIPFGETIVHFPALEQGQGFENIGDETLSWYAPWYDSNGIRVASWARDRLGYFQSFLGPEQNSHFISAPLDLENKPARIYMNIDGISEYSQVSVEILDERFKEIPGYTQDACTNPVESGLRQSVRWKNQEVVEKVKSPVRIRVNFEGARPEDLKLYALYIEHTS